MTSTQTPALPSLPIFDGKGRLADLPIARVETGERNAQLGHFLLAPYESTEPHMQTVVLIDPTRPAAVILRPGCRKVTRRNVLAVRLRSLDELRVGLATDLTNVTAPWFGVREWTRETRRAGHGAHASQLVLRIPNSC